MRGICTMYGLPCTKYKARESKDMVAEHVDIPRDSSHGNTMCWPDISWDEGCHSFVFVVDCQPLQRITCGRTPLLNDSYFSLFRRILDNLKDIFKEGFVPPRLVDDPVLWVRREKNKLADYLCNVTMDRKQSWSRTRSIDMPSKYHWFAVSDGGARPVLSLWMVCRDLSRTNILIAPKTLPDHPGWILGQNIEVKKKSKHRPITMNSSNKIRKRKGDIHFL